MATTAVLFYEVTPGQYRGVSIGHMGGALSDQLQERFGSEREAIIDFIETGTARGGYRYAIDEEPLWESDDESAALTNHQLADDLWDYTWFLQADGTLKLATITSTVTITLTVS